MSTVLLVDADATRRDKRQRSLAELNQFGVRAVESGRAALEELQQDSVAVLVTQLDLPQIDALDLLCRLSQQRIPAVCLLCAEEDRVAEVPEGLPVAQLQWLPADVKFTQLASAIFESLAYLDGGFAPRGLRLADVLPLIERQAKSTRLELLSATGEKGFVYFQDGVLLDAHAGDLGGEAAVLLLASWESVSLKLSALPAQRASGRRLGESAMRRLLGAPARAVAQTRLKDDQADEAAVVAMPAEDPVNAPRTRDRLPVGLWSPELDAICRRGEVALLDARGHRMDWEAARQKQIARGAALELDGILTAIEKTIEACCLGSSGRGATLQTSSHVLVIRPVQCPDRGVYHLVGVLPMPGDAYLLSLQLQRAAAHLGQILARANAPGMDMVADLWHAGIAAKPPSAALAHALPASS